MNMDESITIPIKIGPPKYQTTIPKKARQILDCDEKTVILEADLRVRKVLDDHSDGGDE